MWYSIVFSGVPVGRRFPTYTDKAEALDDASRLKGTGTCTEVRVYECDNWHLAKTSSISRIRSGERVISRW